MANNNLTPKIRMLEWVYVVEGSDSTDRESLPPPQRIRLPSRQGSTKPRDGK